MSRLYANYLRQQNRKYRTVSVALYSHLLVSITLILCRYMFRRNMFVRSQTRINATILLRVLYILFVWLPSSALSIFYRCFSVFAPQNPSFQGQQSISLALAYIMDIRTIDARASRFCASLVASQASSFALLFPIMPLQLGTQCSEKVALLILSLIFSTRFRLSLIFRF